MARRIVVILIVVVAALGVASLSLAAPQAADADWHATYWNNENLEGDPAWEQSEDAIDYDWGEGAPRHGVNADHFSVRWTRTIAFEAGTYRFNVTSDDGARLWVGSTLLIDDWASHEARLDTADITLNAGEHKVTVEYHESTGDAVIKVSWEKITVTPTPTPTATPTPATPPSTTPVSATPVSATPIPTTDVGESSVVPDTLLPGGYVLVDTYSTGFVRGGPPANWHLAAGGQGSDHLWTYGYNRLDGNYNWARWYPTLGPKAYEVFAFIPAGHGTTGSARYWVHTSGGYTLVVVDQGSHQGQWVSLGRYYFSSAFYEFVSLSNVTFDEPGTTQVAFDAIMWVPIP
ncbi:MAG: PA14 domain-containing protein [Chloroflexota bacterium]